MKHFLLTATLIGLSSLIAQSQEVITYHQCDFNDAIPGEYARYDIDGQKQHYTMTQAGIVQGEAWSHLREVRDANYYAGSPCRYKPDDDGNLYSANDWLITPEVWIRGNNATLSWRGQSVCEQDKIGAGYQVLISEKGNTPDDFTDAAVFSITEESVNSWSDHTVSLADYTGKRIYIAFVNNSATGEIIGIDDILVQGEKGLAQFDVTTNGFVTEKENFSVGCRVISMSQEPITRINAYYRYNDEVYNKVIEGISLTENDTLLFDFDEVINLPYGNSIEYTVWAEINGVDFEEIACTTTTMLFKTTKRSVIEEGTGMWCQYCPLGIVAFDILSEKYPDTFIGIALHTYPQGDVLAVSEYADFITFPEGNPSGWVNRKYYVEKPMYPVTIDKENTYTTLNGGFETHFLQAQSEVAPADITTVATVKEGIIEAQTTVRFALVPAHNNYRIAYTLTEDNVWGDGYYQANYYSGSKENVFGFESLPSVITEGMVFNHVARDNFDYWQGIEGSLPEVINMGEEILFEKSFDLPASVLNTNNIHLISMLIDMNTGEIVNANITRFDAGIDAPSLSQSQIKAWQESDNCIVNFATESDSPITVALYNATGMCIDRVNASGNCRTALNAGGCSGVCFVVVSHEGRNYTQKVIIR